MIILDSAVTSGNNGNRKLSRCVHLQIFFKEIEPVLDLVKQLNGCQKGCGKLDRGFYHS